MPLQRCFSRAGRPYPIAVEHLSIRNRRRPAIDRTSEVSIFTMVRSPMTMGIFLGQL